jgi:predicted TIM-barrel fold metal-dependent hydrolase
MGAEFTVVDADAHYLESIGDLTPYVDEPWRSRFANDRNVLPSSTGDRTVYGRIQREHTGYQDYEGSVEEIPAIMEFLGFDAIVMLSQKMLSFARIRGDDERMTMVANAFVDYCLDQIVDPAEGIYTMIPAPYASPEETVELIDRVGDERGIVGVCMVCAGPEPPLGNRRYDPVYEACVDHDLPVVFHAGGAGLNEYHVRGYEKFIETHTLGFLEANMAQLTSIVAQGVPEKFPSLDVVFQESGLAWVPMMMHRLDAEYLKRQSEAPLLQRRPSEYIEEFYFGTQPLEAQDPAFLERVIDDIGGTDHVMYASDYPHWDYDHPRVITDLEFLSTDEKAKILGGNAQAVFGI